VKVPLCLQLSPALAHAAADVGKFLNARLDEHKMERAFISSAVVKPVNLKFVAL
jgi:hypothetical protein